MSKKSTVLSAAALLAFLPAVALAHPGHLGDHIGFLNGFTHPFTGLDHLLAMLSVGIWSAMAAPRHVFRIPLTFAALLAVGAVLGMSGVALPAVEPMIAVSLLLLGLFIAVQVKMPLAAGMAVVGFFALFHGLAHGSELSGGLALLGMTLGTLIIHFIGIGIGKALMRQHRLALPIARVSGAAISLAGVGFLTGVL
ncbi:MAG: HupE/UreJ family protein [Zoogloeaceae bacterium]|jgi:urease accessory protein|nr:HupE/UreJ family protein [Zoogloeaceae bacterium]